MADLGGQIAGEGRKQLIAQLVKWVLGGAALLVAAAALGWWFYFERQLDDYISKKGGIPRGAVVAFDLRDGCPTGWGWIEFEDVRGRFIVGAGEGKNLTHRPFGESLGKENYILLPENLPPHRHEVYVHAGEMIADGTVAGAGGGDTNWKIRNGLTGSGVGVASSPYNVMPPYIALRYCKKI